MYIGNRLTGAYGIGVFKLRHTFSNYIIRILECQLFFTHILHFFVTVPVRKKMIPHGQPSFCEAKFSMRAVRPVLRER